MLNFNPKGVNMFDLLMIPFQFTAMQNAFLICIIVSIPTALLSCFLVLKGWALVGDAISHAVLPGIVIAYIIGLPLIIGAFLAAMFCAVSTGYLSENSRVKPDTIMGVVFSGMFAFGIVIYVAIDTELHLDHILFGNMLGVSKQELINSGIISIFVASIIILKWRDFLLHAFDPTQAKSSGLRVEWLHYGLLALISLTIVATLNAAGLILAIGLLISPGAIAFLLTKQFSTMMRFATLINVITMVFGTYISFFIDSAPAPTIILTQSAVFMILLIKKLWVDHNMTINPES